jgi:DNA-binding CsgD family transcriptional regulator
MARSGYDRAIDKIVRLADQSRDLVSFWRESAGVVADAIPHYWSPCWLTVDPASLLITGHFHEGLESVPPEWLATEYLDDGALTVSDVLTSGTGVAALHDVTGGDPTHSRRWQVNMRTGADQEMFARLQLPTGEVWGALGLYREPGSAMFNDREKRFLAAAAPHLAQGTRHAVMQSQTSEPNRQSAPSLIVLSDGWEIRSTTPGAEHWLADLPGGDPGSGRLPAAVLAVATHALHKTPNPQDGSSTSMSRVLGRSGTWVVLHAACLEGTGERRVAVIVEPAHPEELLPILMSAYQLTPRERDITRLVLGAATTTEIARTLVISPHTVQQHLKSIFDKTNVRSRRELTGKIFFAHPSHGERSAAPPRDAPEDGA